MMILFLSILAVFSIIVCVVAKFKKISINQAFCIVLDWIKRNWFTNENNCSFVLYPSGFEQVFNIVVKHSRLDAEKTMWKNSGFEIMVQILPQTELSIAAAIEESKIYIKNIAVSAGFPDIDIDAYDIPFLESSRLAYFYIATTKEQKRVLALNQYKRMHQAILEADIAQQPFTDPELDKDMQEGQF